MDLDKFLTSFQKSDNDSTYMAEYKEQGRRVLAGLPELNDLISRFAGARFEKGLFTIHSEGSFYKWTEITFEYFKKFQGSSYCFAYDWVGRQYALNYRNGEHVILVLDPATADVFELPAGMESFFTDELNDLKTEVLEIDKFSTLLKKLDTDLKYGECLGFIMYLFIGGKDVLDNYEVTDMEVYWELNRQIYDQIKNLPPGTAINLSIK